jgi:glucarate dehydratase
MTLLGDRACSSAEEVLDLVACGAVGAVNVKVRRTGITESLRIANVCQAAGLPVILGTDSASRVGALARLHLRAGVASLDPWPTETFFFNHLADDVFDGDFYYDAGVVTLGEEPGFGVRLDMAKVKRFSL